MCTSHQVSKRLLSSDQTPVAWTLPVGLTLEVISCAATMTLPPRLSYIKLRNAQEIESAELVLDGGRYPIPKQGRGIFSRSFHEPLTFATGQLSLLVGRKKSRFGFSSQTVSESISICAAEIFSILERQRVRKKDNKVSLTLGFLSVTFGVSFQMNQIKPVVHTRMLLNDQSTSARAYPEGLWQATEDLIKRCPRFRILVIGKLGVGRFTLIKRVFGVETTNITDSPLPRAGVENELTSPQNDRLALHIFNAHEGYDKVEAFIEQKECMSDVKNQLHAVWYVILRQPPRRCQWTRKVVFSNTHFTIRRTAFGGRRTRASTNNKENPGKYCDYIRVHQIRPACKSYAAGKPRSRATISARALHPAHSGLYGRHGHCICCS